MKSTSSSKWPVIILALALALVIGALVFTTQYAPLAPAIPVVSIVLGWLLKAISDTLTEDRQRLWHLEDEARAQTLRYYEAKLDDLSRLVVDEIRLLNTEHWSTESGNLRTIASEPRLTHANLLSAGSARSFIQVMADPELQQDYRDAMAQRKKLYGFVTEVNAGRQDSIPESTLLAKAKTEAETYIAKLVHLQTTLERVRIRALRGELTLNTRK